MRLQGGTGSLRHRAADRPATLPPWLPSHPRRSRRPLGKRLPGRDHLWLAARYRCADDAALAADRIRRAVDADDPGSASGPELRLSGSTLVVEFQPAQRDAIIRHVRRTHGRLIAI